MEEYYDFQAAAKEAKKSFGNLIETHTKDFAAALNFLLANLATQEIRLSDLPDEKILEFAGLDMTVLQNAQPEVKIFIANLLKTEVERIKNKFKEKTKRDKSQN